MNDISLNNLYSSNKFWKTSGSNIITTNTGNLGIGITNPLFKLDVAGSINISSNLNVGGDIGNVKILNTVINANNFDHSSAPLTVTNQKKLNSSEPEPVLNLCRQGYDNIYGNKTSFNLTRWDTSVGLNSRTRMDINLTHDLYDGVNIMSIRSDRRVGIGKTNPNSALDVVGDINISSGSSYKIDGVALNFDGRLVQGSTGILHTSSNIGIGTSNPQYKLDVVGDINIPLGSNYKIGGVPLTLDGRFVQGSTVFYILVVILVLVQIILNIN